MDLRLFKQEDLFNATLTFFRDTIGLQLQAKSKMPVNLESQFESYGIKSKKVKEVWSHIDNTYYIGLLDDDNFEKEIAEQEKSDLQEDLEDVEQSDDEYPGILIFAVDLNDGFNPTRSNLTEINRTLNRFSQRVPALVLARYGKKISLMLADRVAYKQEWREGEKVRKVSLLRDIDLDKPHAGHLRILKDLVVPTSGTKVVENFNSLYEYWKEVLDTSELNKKFYQDLSNWYFWAIKHVRFPDEPTAEDAHEQNKELDDMLQEHRATNVIRLLTRLLFVWFIKEKGLIPEELFDLRTLQKDILRKITPHHEHGMFKEANKESIYYKAILQNLFFATLNCPIEASSTDNRERGFRKPSSNYGVTFLMRHEDYFKDRDAFLKLVNNKVPFLNGGLFECLDIRGEKEDKEDRVWVDGFSDNLPKEHKLIVPDFLFFGVEEEVDLSEDYGLKNRKYKEAAVKGLLNIFNSYKFTITENTPIEEDVALDPELLGKVFENLLASYNPETKTTARKQTGSFYTPREIVNYMVDESLIAYLENTVEDWGVSEEELDEKLRQLTSYEETVPFEGNKELHREIITALSNCTILDPACGSGAFPMGILQKMVHILQKLDPDNEVWKEVQKEKASKEADRAISEIEDKEERGQRLQEINEAFDERMNAPDYARKLFLVENCIYGVDIQPVATQISKLRFFISLVVEQKVGDDKSDNFGIRPLPNLETKFVTANTLIDIKDNSNQTSLYETDKIKRLEAELKRVRSKLFSARTTDTKYKYRQEDERLRNEIAEELKQTGWPNDAADKLASWDPYDQNASSPFFNPEWMFDIRNGFKLVIGNPPYVLLQERIKEQVDLEHIRNEYEVASYKVDLYHLFYERGINLSNSKGVVTYITPTNFLLNNYTKTLRKKILESNISKVLLIKDSVFEASVDTGVFLIDKSDNRKNSKVYFFEGFLNGGILELKKKSIIDRQIFETADFLINPEYDPETLILLKKLELKKKLGEISTINFGMQLRNRKKFPNDVVQSSDQSHLTIHHKKCYTGRDIKEFVVTYNDRYCYFHEEAKSGGCWDKEKHFAKKKLLIPQVGKFPVAGIDPEGYPLLNTAFMVIPHDKETNYVLQAIINSRLVRYYWLQKFYDQRQTFPKIKGTYLKKIPLPDDLRNYTANFLSTMISFKISLKESVIRDALELLIIELYFKEMINGSNIEINELAYKEISTLCDDSFENLNDSKKEQVIEQLSDRWSDPENEVRKRINSFPTKSPDILKPILEG